MGRNHTTPCLGREGAFDEPGKAVGAPDRPRRGIFLAVGLIALATVAAFSNSFAGPFVFDDKPAIAANPTIRHLWPLWKAVCPPNRGESVTGRPLLNLSLAVNYAISELDVWSYHATNLAIHLLGSLLLFGILRRTFLLPAMREQWGAVATPLAFVVALFWAIHPLQTESVTYIVQRAESLVGLFYLLTLYCFLRGVGSARAVVWHTGAILACLLGMASKEVMVSAPLIVLLYDRTFLAGSFREAWRRRGRFYAALAGTWLLLGWLVISAGGRGGTAGFGVGISWWAYLCTQFGAIVHYLRLCVWPHPLLLDYGHGTAHGVGEILPYAVVLGLLGAATVAALCRWPKVGFLGAWFFAILAPTSSVVPVATQTVAEHRMYLPLAAVLTGLVVGGYFVGRRLACRQKIPPLGLRIVDISLVACAAIALGIATFQRNATFRSGLSIWQDTVARAPGNERAHNNLGVLLAACGQTDEAIIHYQMALGILPDYGDAHNNFGVLLAGRGQLDEAIAHFQKAVAIKPDSVEAHYNLGKAQLDRGQVGEAATHFQKVIELQPDYADAHNSLGVALAGGGQIDEAIAHYKKAIEIEADYADAHNNLGVALASGGQFDEAIAHYRKALGIRPDYVDAHNNLGLALVGRGQIDEAIAHYKKAIEIKPGYAEAHDNLGNVLADRGQVEAAIVHYQRALEIQPDYAKAHNNLGVALAGQGQVDAALAHFERALDIKPDDAEARQNRDLALARRESVRQGLAQRRELILSRPSDANLLNDTAWILATNPNASVRDGAEAVALAERAVELSGGREPAVLDTLAAAYAEAGRFAEAVQTARKALALAGQQNKRGLAESIQAKIRLYEGGTPFRESQVPTAKISVQP